MTDGDGSNRKLVMGEDGKHIYGGAISPDGKYVLFTPSMTDGGIETGLISIMRLADAPIIRGESTIHQMGEAILNLVIAVASGKTHTKAEDLRQDDFIPWKRGVSL